MEPTLLILSLLPLLAGPLVVWAIQSAQWAARLLDGFVMVSVGGIVLLYILPASISAGGGMAVGAAILGLALPFVIERLFGFHSAGVRGAVLLLGFTALALHAVLDGIALCGQHGEGGSQYPFLGISVALHRVPVGIAIWWIVYRRRGMKAALVVMGTIVAGSVIGFVWKSGAVDAFTGAGWAVFQALVAGSLLHVAAGHAAAPFCHECEEGWQPASGLGGLLGVAVLAGFALLDPDHHMNSMSMAMETFMHLALESAPALLAAYIVAGAIQVFFPDILAGSLRGGTRMGQAARGALLGLPVNICSCGVVPVYKGLIQRGIPAPAAMAFLVAAPEVGVASMLLSFRLLGMELTLVRVAVAVVLALFMGVWIGGAVKRTEEGAEQSCCNCGPDATLAERIKAGLAFGFSDVVDQTVPWLLVGMGVAAVLAPLLRPEITALLPAGLDVPMMALIGVPVYVCASGSTPLAAVLIAGGLSPGAAIAFLLTGPATNVTTFGILSGMHGKRVAVMFAVGVGGGAIVLGYLANLMLPDTVSLPLGEAVHEGHGMFSWISLAVMAVLTITSLFRQGTRGFVSRVVTLDQYDAEHEHG